MNFEQNWSEYFNDSISFDWTLSIPVNNLNWEEKILFFDLEFMKIGREYKLLYFQEDIINLYYDNRKNNFFMEGNKRLSLLSFEDFFGVIGKKYDYFIDIPVQNGRLVTIDTVCYQRPFMNLKILEFDNYSELYLDVLALKEFWEGELSLRIISSSNIWFSELEYKSDNSFNSFKLKKNVNNELISNEITPRFNSFLKKLKKIIFYLDGKITLNNCNKKYVIDEGVLLNGKIFYM